MQAAQFSGAH